MPFKPHKSVRGRFAYELYKLMQKNEDIYIIVGDLGYGMFDPHREAFADRFFNVGASEQAMMDIAIGLALTDKIPVVYTITPFLIYRPFESIVKYVDRENIPVKLIGSGIGDDYKTDGASHWFAKDSDLYEMQNVDITEVLTEADATRLTKQLIMDKDPHIVLLRR